MNFIYISGMIIWLNNMIDGILDKDVLTFYLSAFFIILLFMVYMIENKIKERSNQ